jgi:hypothetical protein
MSNLPVVLLPEATSVIYGALIPGASTSGTKLNVAYLEYVNGNPIQPPDVVPAEIGTYFAALANTTDRDYLRCNILSHTVKVVDGVAVLSLIIVSDGDVGVFGKPFSATANSHIYSITLAASQVNNKDDILFARANYATSQQIPKPENGGIMATLNLELTFPQ